MFSEKEYLTVKRPLRFRKDGKFRILFLTDLHGGVGMNPQNKPAVDAILNAVNPDMVLIGGDTFGCVIGCTTPEEVREYLDIFMEIPEKRHIPWAHVYGNHDDNLGVSKEVQQEIYESYPFCVSKRGEEGISGVGNYVLPILHSDSDEPAVNIWALDSHRSTPQVDQAIWYYQTSQAIEKCYGRKIPSIMYMHISLPEYHDMVAHPEECRMVGTINGELEQLRENPGLFAMCRERGDVKAIFCGHDHLHDASGVYKGIRLSYAASCSYDAGSDERVRGGRIIELSEEKPDEINTYMVHLIDIMGIDAVSRKVRLIQGPEKDFAIYADIWHGNGRRCLPEAEGITRSWRPTGGLCGNTSPAVFLPFGRLSVGCYDGGYPSGCSNLCVNDGSQQAKRLGVLDRSLGFSHMHQSGVGRTSAYYNYAVVRPCYGDITESAQFIDLRWKDGFPGYFATDLKNKILCELTVSPLAACHRYWFRGEGGSIVIDLTHEGVESYHEEFHSHPKSIHIRLCGKDAFEAEAVMRGVKLYIYGYCESAESVSIWDNYVALEGEKEVSLGEVWKKVGVCFSLTKAGAAQLRLSISTRSVEKAREDVLAEKRSFEEIRNAAYRSWNDYMGRIEVEAPTERDKRIFYSNFYHSLVKPSDRSGESYVWDGDGDFVTDIAALHDMYKTQMPLLFTLYPEISEKLIQTFIDYGNAEGVLPDCLTVSAGYKSDNGACMAAVYCIYDAFMRGVKADYKAALRMVENALAGASMCNVPEFAEACACMCELARKLGVESSSWDRRKAEGKRHFEEGKDTGVLFFRPTRDMENRMELAGGKEEFARRCDRFFGFTDSEDSDLRFSGFNQTYDMDTPVSYYYGGRHDRMCEVIDAGMRELFAEGSGGLPGNNASGALSSLYVWYAVGLIPVSGQNKMILCAPRMCKTVMHLANGKDFTIERKGEGIYLMEAYLNDRKLSDFSIRASDMMEGGILRIVTAAQKKTDGNRI